MTYQTQKHSATQDSVNNIQRKILPTQFADNRAATNTQHQQQEMMAASSHVTAQRALIDTMAVAQPKAIQRAADEELQMKTIQRAEEEELMQGKFDVAQRAEEEELMQGKFAVAQRAEEEELMQGKFAVAQLAEEEELMQGKFANTSIQRKEAAIANTTGLPDNLKSGIEHMSGYSMDDVKVHYNSSSPAQMQAHAYAQGTDIHVAPGQEKHLPHEAWHVVQQKQGRVNPTIQAKGVAINDDAGLETEADVMGAKAAQMKFEADHQKK